MSVTVQTTNKDIISHSKRHKIFIFFYGLCMHYIFQGIVMFAIILNTLILALDRYPISKTES